MSFDDNLFAEEELRQAAQEIFGQHNIIQKLNGKCLYSMDIHPSFGEIPIMYTEFHGKDRSKLRTRTVYVSVN